VWHSKDSSSSLFHLLSAETRKAIGINQIVSEFLRKKTQWYKSQTIFEILRAQSRGRAVIVSIDIQWQEKMDVPAPRQQQTCLSSAF
jgi:hypothetical protein